MKFLSRIKSFRLNMARHPNKRTLILHVGMPKTGTTTIQETLGQNAKRLRAAGFHYPATRPFNHSNTFTPAFMDHPENTVHFKRNGIQETAAIRKEQQRLRDLWKRELRASDSRSFIISAENLSKLHPHEIEQVRQFVAAHFDDTRIIAYAREPEVHIRSTWQQHVKTLSHGETKNELLQQIINSYNLDFLEHWAKPFGRENVVARRFHRDYFLNGDLMQDFIHTATGQALELEPCHQANESLGKWSTTLLYEYNSALPLFLNGGLNPNKGLADKLNVFFGILRRVDDEKLDFTVRFTPSQAAKINRQIETINQFFEPRAVFQTIADSDEETDFPEFSDIPNDYFVQLINEYNKTIDRLAGK